MISKLFLQRIGFFFVTPIIFVLVITFSCSSNNRSQTEQIKSKEKTSTQKKSFQVIVLNNKNTLHFGETINISVKSNGDIEPDSIRAEYKKKELELSKKENMLRWYHLNSDYAGKKNIMVYIYHSQGIAEIHNIKILHLPKSPPETLRYKLVRTFKHDPEAYTQGLFFHNNYIYESTGIYNQSSIRKIDPKNGDIVQIKSLESNYFGEGITLIDNKIYMLTYREKVCFVFDINTFNIVSRFRMQTSEGWGITTLGEKLIMSDGSSSLYYIDPEFFTLTKQTEICDNINLIDSINELEYTPEGIYANIYGKDYIVRIDLHKNIVTHKLDLTDLFPEKMVRDMDHVLNGIAYNENSNTFYVTGKQWDTMHEIMILPN